MFKKLKKRILDWLKRNRLKDTTTSQSSVAHPFVNRDQTILNAKEDIQNLLNTSQPQPIGICEWGYDPKSHVVEFVVDKKARRVEVIMRFKNDDEVLAKACAQCKTTDVFNSDIGKAISLHRLFNLQVPFKYLNCENPHYPTNGSIVEHTANKNVFRTLQSIYDVNHLLKVEVLKDNIFKSSNYVGTEKNIRCHMLKVLDDSNDGDYEIYK